MKKADYESPRLEFVFLAETVKTLTQNSDTDAEGSAVLLSWLIG